ncbi:hypothetical protein Slin15195_G030340 [Septoria linicola]|uniref:Uncharacterized protein n=1 Tax=Septoria linicola TaxID=215465 RepID=A0A9Q9AIL4_9PEZI|nr:hypothetical protein Slin14017_G029360 [Septoria linicola]USW49715.1 hypothetical protein Slin15195_G030340 [Septoria linicola]
MSRARKEESGQYAIEGTNKQNQQDPVAWHVMELRRWHDKYSFPLSLHIAQLEQLLQPPLEAARIDQVMWNIIFDMGDIGDILDTIRCHRPRGVLPPGITTPKSIADQDKDWSKINSFDSLRWTQQTKSPTIVAFMERCYDAMKIDLTETVGGIDHPYLELVAPLEGFVGLPRPTDKISRGALAVLDRSHATLNNLWSKVQTWRMSRCRFLCCNAEQAVTHHFNIFVKPLMGATHMSKDPWERERALSLSAIEAKESKAIFPSGKPSTYIDTIGATRSTWGVDAPDPILSASLPREKVKTRPKVVEVTPRVEEDGIIVNDAPQTCAVPIPVNKSSLTLFQRMFNPLMGNRARQAE